MVTHFNVGSTNDGYLDDGLGLRGGLKSGMLNRPGSPILHLLPGASQ